MHTILRMCIVKASTYSGKWEYKTVCSMYECNSFVSQTVFLCCTALQDRWDDWTNKAGIPNVGGKPEHCNSKRVISSSSSSSVTSLTRTPTCLKPTLLIQAYHKAAEHSHTSVGRQLPVSLFEIISFLLTLIHTVYSCTKWMNEWTVLDYKA